jgi:hypothetical protein
MTTGETAPAPRNWEYMTMSRKSENYLLNDLNQVGQERWELVTILFHKDAKGAMAWTAFLKRPMIEGAPVAASEKRVAAAASQAAEEEELTEELQGFDLSGDDFEIRQP